MGSNTVQSFCYVPLSDLPLLLPCLFPRFSFRPPPPPSLHFLALTRTSPVTNSFTGWPSTFACLASWASAQGKKREMNRYSIGDPAIHEAARSLPEGRREGGRDDG